MAGWHSRRGSLLLSLLGASTFALLLMLELSQEDEPLTAGDLLSEVLGSGLLVGCTAATAALLLRVQAQEEEHRLLRRDLQAMRTRNERWREQMAAQLRELGSAIQAQFAAWRLTPSEQQVGLLLLKGFSHKEIARLRRTSEATVRQQAASLYQKAELDGRAALSAFFLEDLLLPGTPPRLSDGDAASFPSSA
jgi:DNA-binding CsgD family transcriptional regulator